MRTIFKYPLQSEVRMPVGAQILCVQNQLGRPVIWAVVDTENDDEIRRFEWYLTGTRVPEASGDNYIGTCQFDNGAYVEHYFEV